MKHRWLVIALALAVIAPPALAAAEAGVDPAEAGKALYTKKCAMCHGANGVAKATAKGSANLNDAEWLAKTSDEAIADVIVKGKNKMPKSDKLTPDEVRSIVLYVRTLK